ncbi:MULTISPECIES: MarR family winged helix-turn-helix transcriptional regulator [Amycolatopsis]|uniref:DNA-binding transcriptional regulator, MarR family n=2 Tax=Amycolatopsis TaxID=1813 RepID=A0A1I3NHG8_9PSEU|nr:MarR family transcriptional regulator [Amycolatopsis sacchari]SFJ08617.1 DNA-binding transcriptional regulator, MarR family [Amycolatopsis sacchari]
MAKSAKDVPIPELGAELRTAVARVYSRFRSERADGEVAEAALLVLHQLRKHGPLSLGELSDRARVTPGSMSQTVNRLEADGQVVRERDSADRRRVLFVLTAGGREIAEKSLRHRENWLSSQLGALTADQRRTLAEAARLLQAIADSPSTEGSS